MFHYQQGEQRDGFQYATGNLKWRKVRCVLRLIEFNLNFILTCLLFFLSYSQQKRIGAPFFHGFFASYSLHLRRTNAAIASCSIWYVVNSTKKNAALLLHCAVNWTPGSFNLQTAKVWLPDVTFVGAFTVSHSSLFSRAVQYAVILSCIITARTYFLLHILWVLFLPFFHHGWNIFVTFIVRCTVKPVIVPISFSSFSRGLTPWIVSSCVTIFTARSPLTKESRHLSLSIFFDAECSSSFLAFITSFHQLVNLWRMAGVRTRHETILQWISGCEVGPQRPGIQLTSLYKIF